MSNTKSKHRIHKIGLSKEDNPEFYKIVDTYNDIMDRWNKINLRIHELKQPRIFLFCQKSQIKSFNDPMTELTTDYLAWNKQARNFLYKPNLIFSEEQEKEMGFIHFMNVLSDMLNQLSGNMILIGDNFVKVQERHKNQVNFTIAIFSTVISLTGLGLAVYALFLN